MRTIVRYGLAILVACLPSAAHTQERRPKIEKIEVGFQTYSKQEETAYKVGLWTPVYIEVAGGMEGAERKGNNRPYLEIQTADSEDVFTKIAIPVDVKPNETGHYIGYVKTGRMSSGTNEVQVTLHSNNKTYENKAEQYHSLHIDSHLYLTLGGRMMDIHTALTPPKGNEKEQLNLGMFNPLQTRHVVFENDVRRLPEFWFGYNSMDVIILSTENEKFLKNLNNDPERLRALATWVRRGGRLVIPIAHRNQHLVAQILESKIAWNPPIPPQVVPPRSPGNVAELALPRLPKVEDWGGVQGKAFERANQAKIEVARLDAGTARTGDWEVFADAADGRPLIARVRYGLGQITYLAFSFDDAAFAEWQGKEQFLKTMLIKLGPRAPAEGFDQGMMIGQFRNIPNDLSTDLLAMLDNFDVTIIPFGYVALFIVLYILVVGPLDFILLKFVFKRLEWTWITFPAVVLGVSVIAYFAAYALKGRDLKMNKIDVVDFDLRTSLDDKRRPTNVHAYGNTFFTILSPRIQNYTIGVEPNPEFWGDKAEKPRTADLVAWMGRPSGGMNEMRRSGSAGFFRKPYEFTEDASGLRGVPIPVWTTKAFCSSWEQSLAAPPFTVDLVYHTKLVDGRQVKITGKLDNHLGVDLFDCWLIYQEECFPLPGGLKRIDRGVAGKDIVVPAAGDMLIPPVRDWIHRQAEGNEAAPDAKAWNVGLAPKMKQFLFLHQADAQNVVRNHLFRPLDLGWRITEDRQPGGLREAILFARVRSLSGDAETLTSDAAHPLPTKLWLNDLPDPQRPRPRLAGQMNQETFIRVILPVRPAE
jgi:hypothetical protein